ncbi:hypothetical protein HGRIS_008772 [Hohenbuehelia grisea]|uniref:F-box domain-containing protein n=1 Tax=Hohenbuehelia grisea TaxID=104357 RepID=A0ABR3J8Z8_9AGAR
MNLLSPFLNIAQTANPDSVNSMEITQIQNLVLPTDVLREILEQSAYSDRRMALRLVLLNRLIHTWIDPILYQTILLLSDTSTEKFLIATETKPAKGFSRVKRLYLRDRLDQSAGRKIINLCSRIEELSCTSDPLCVFTQLRPDFSQSLYSQVTHLEYMDLDAEMQSWSIFQHLPNLTHLHLPRSRHFDITETRDAGKQISRAFNVCRTLEVLLLVTIGEPTSHRGLELTGDPRVVVLYDFGVRGMDSVYDEQWRGWQAIWELAERVVQAQRGALESKIIGLGGAGT